MTLLSVRKVYQGIADRRQMFRMFDRHAQRPDRFQDDASALYGGEWFEISEAEHDYMFEILPPLWMRGEMFALGEFLTDRITSIFYALNIDGAWGISTDIATCSTRARLSGCAMRSSNAKPVPFGR